VLHRGNLSSLCWFFEFFYNLVIDNTAPILLRDFLNKTRCSLRVALLHLFEVFLHLVVHPLTELLRQSSIELIVDLECAHSDKATDICSVFVFISISVVCDTFTNCLLHLIREQCKLFWNTVHNLKACVVRILASIKFDAACI